MFAQQEALESALAREPRVLHVIRERDVGLFSLIQQVMANVPWALHEGRVPVVDFRDRTAYWTPRGHQGGDSVWEYYFEPVVDGLPSSAVPPAVTERIEAEYPDQNELGFFAADDAFVSNHFGDDPRLHGIAPAVPYVTADPDRPLREWTSEIMRSFVRPRAYVEAKAGEFFDAHMRGSDVIGVHVRGTDAVSAQETRDYRQGSLDLARYERELGRLLEDRPEARILVATDAQASLDRLAETFGERVLAYDAVRHTGGEAAGSGPTGCIMPAYVTADRDTAAQNGEDAVVEWLLLSRCCHLVHNGASLAMTVLLREPDMPHTNTHVRT
ncbi:MAG TPA: hypothetical protein VF715_04940 [Thermoleophilaceae bacterium]